MALIKEIEAALLFVEKWQRDIGCFVSMMVTSHDHERTMTLRERERLVELDNEEFEGRLKRSD